MIGNMSELLRSTLGEHIKIEIVAAAGLWTISADTQQLENAILNIASAKLSMRDADTRHSSFVPLAVSLPSQFFVGRDKPRPLCQSINVGKL
jgi:hypothetical protein